MKSFAAIACAAIFVTACSFNAADTRRGDFSDVVACAVDTCLTVEIDGSVGRLRGDILIPDNAAQDGKVPAVIICHGLTASRDEPLFNGFALAMQRVGMVAVKFDFNGHGESDGNLMGMTVLNEREDLERIYGYLKSLYFVDPSRIAVLGHSQGGAVAGLFAADHPELGALVLCASASLSLQLAPWTGHFINADFDKENVPDSIPSFGDRYLGREFITTLKDVDLTGALAKYKGPACIINGEKDYLVPVPHSRVYHALMPRSELHILDGLGHSYRQDPGRVTDICTDFLSKVL